MGRDVADRAGDLVGVGGRVEVGVTGLTVRRVVGVAWGGLVAWLAAGEQPASKMNRQKTTSQKRAGLQSINLAVLGFQVTQVGRRVNLRAGHLLDERLGLVLGAMAVDVVA